MQSAEAEAEEELPCWMALSPPHTILIPSMQKETPRTGHALATHERNPTPTGMPFHVTGNGFSLEGTLMCNPATGSVPGAAEVVLEGVLDCVADAAVVQEETGLLMVGLTVEVRRQRATSMLFMKTGLIRRVADVGGSLRMRVCTAALKRVGGPVTRAAARQRPVSMCTGDVVFVRVAVFRAGVAYNVKVGRRRLVNPKTLLSITSDPVTWMMTATGGGGGGASSSSSSCSCSSAISGV